jgi:hypothetical protein
MSHPLIIRRKCKFACTKFIKKSKATKKFKMMKKQNYSSILSMPFSKNFFSTVGYHAKDFLALSATALKIL